MPSDIPVDSQLRVRPSGEATPDPRSRGSRQPRPNTQKPFSEGPSRRQDRVSHMARGLEGEHQQGVGPEQESCHARSEGRDEPSTDAPGRFIDVIV